MFEHEEDTVESLFGQPAEEPTAPAPPAQKESAKRGRKPILGDRPMTGAERMQRNRAGERAREDKSASRYNSTTEITRAEAKEILRDQRHIRNEHVIDVCISLAKTACQMLKLPFCRYVFTHGIYEYRRALGMKKDIEPPAIEDVWKPGNALRQHELRALWDYSMSWRLTPAGDFFTFEDFLTLRRIVQTDTYTASCRIHGKDFEEQPHGRWCNEHFVQRNPDLLPEAYGQKDIAKALAGQDSCHKRMLLAARNSFKTSVDICDLVGWICCFHDLRILICSSTNPLAAGIIRSVRSFFIVRNPQEPTLFQQLWPELCIDDDSAKGTYICPMRRLQLIQPTLQSTSAESKGQAGERADYIVYEDVCEQTNVTTEELRQKTIDTYDLLNELLEPSGFIQICGTAWSADAPGDLYKVIKEREDARQEKELLYTIDPCWKVKEGVDKKPYDVTLTEDELELLLPSRLSFKWLKAKLRNSEKVFRQQQLCEWVSEDDIAVTLSFDQATLNAACVPLSGIPTGGDTLLSLDIAYSMDNRADLSSCAAIRTFDNLDGEKCIGVLDIESGRLKTNELAHLLVTLTQKWNPRIVLAERGPTADSLQNAVTMAAAKYGISVPLWFVTPSNQKNIKFLRIKDLSLLLEQGRLKFATGNYCAALFAEAEKLDGSVNIKNKKNDRFDSLAIAATVMKITSTRPDPKDEKSTEEKENELELIRRRSNDRAGYDRMFGSPSPIDRHPDTPPPAEDAPKPQQRSGRFATLPAGFGRGFRA
jgi:hypothetical protein